MTHTAMRSFAITLQKIKSLPAVAEGLAFAGAIYFWLQALQFAHLQPSILDEGLYLVKGVLFSNGRYTPFQPDGPWTNQMPLSYLIPGFVQMVFGAGLRTGRYFSITLGLLILLGLWILGRRLGGRWWATALVWIIAINPAFANGYSMAVSQVLVACILTWILVIAIDEKAAIWRLALASILAGLLILVRVNMTPVLPMLLIYIFWQHGRRAGLWSSLAGGLAVIIGHAFYWPGILQMWASWIPASLTPFLDSWRIENLGIAIWDPNISLENRLASLWEGIRYNFIPILALVVFGILIVQRKYWRNLFHYRVAVFLTILSALLFLAHAWASLWKNYCVYCFAGYLEFFSPVAILLIPLVFRSWNPGPAGQRSTRARWYGLFASAAILTLFSGAGFGAARKIGEWLIELPVPRLLTGRAGGGSVPLWGVLENGLGIGYKVSRWLAPTLLGFAIGLLLICAAWLIFRWLSRREVNASAGERYVLNLGLIIAGLALILGTLLAPSPLLAGTAALEIETPGSGSSGAAGTIQAEQATAQPERCTGDVIAAMENAGAHLAQVIPPGALVYWQGSLSTVPLLSIPEARIFPAQLNDGYSFRTGGDTAALRRFGLWNEVLRDQWLQEADYIILQQRYYNQDWKSFLESGAYNELSPSPGTDPCRDDSALRIFRRIR